ncbi:Hypothetical predicted protein [Mytilus galloprovincialis]|uniref:SAM domain-containing protein n=1 Tax=Mytilus galloprovincialis TaxID=29158 RepID=A0A8B6C2Z5_MYTGA|nr:Hypothetical predicted protein [Mytilus galloprovincialis]
MTLEGSSSKTMTDVERVLTWADAKKLSEATANAVISLGFDSMEALALLEGEDLQKTKIPIGRQKLLLKSIRQSFKAETENAPKSGNGGLPACPTIEDACAPEVTDIQDGGNNNNHISGLTDTCVGNVLNQLQQQQSASGVINQEFGFDIVTSAANELPSGTVGKNHPSASPNNPLYEKDHLQ